MEDGSFTIAPDVAAIRNTVPPVLRTPRLKTPTHQRNRRERPMCRSAPESTEPLPIIPENVTRNVIQAFSASGVEESTTLEKVPPQDKTSNLGRFLDSLRSRNDIIDGWFHFVHTGYNCNAAERHTGRSLHTLPNGLKWTALVAPIIVNCPLSIVNWDITVNCQLSTVNFLCWRTFVFIYSAQKRMSKIGKKHLTNGGGCGNICKLSGERPPNGPEDGETQKNSLKKVKKGLDKLLRVC